jgi:hypothetical protein
MKPLRLFRLLALFIVATGTSLPARAAAGDPIVFRPAYAPGPADNPLKGFVPYAGQGREFPHSMEFQYLPLAAVMSGPTNFNWSALEHLLDDVASRGCQTVFRFYLEYPRQPSGVPAYLVEAGLELRTWTNTNTQPLPPAIDRTPNYEDPRLRAALTRFIAALGARYDGDPRIACITAGLLGTWGEWHCYPHTEWFASKTVQSEVMDAYETAFQRTPVLLRYPAGEDDPAHAPNGGRRLGYHDDSFGWATLDTGRKQDDWFYLPALRKAGPAAMSRWKTSPIGGEIRPELWPCIWKTGGCQEGQDFAQCVRETHVSWLMDTSTSGPMKPDERERAISAARSLGYELQVLEASAKRIGHRMEVSVAITNRGVAPFSADWPIQVRIAGSGDSGTDAVFPVGLKTILPGSSVMTSVRIDLPDGLRGDLQLRVGVVNPLKGGRPFRFANVSSEPIHPGWLTLGQISGSTVAPDPSGASTKGGPTRTTVLFNGTDLTGWRAPRGAWTTAEKVALDPGKPEAFTIAPGQGVLVNGAAGRTGDLMTEAEFGDIDLHVEFCIPRHSNSGIYLQGRYEIQVYDSHGVAKADYPGIECGGIYPRWVNEQGIEGHSPRVNASKPPGEWQTFRIQFRAPRFDPAGRKTENARMIRVWHNGQLIHENVELKGPTRSAHWSDEKALGPILLQGDHGPVAFRNLRVRPLDPNDAP